MGPAATLDATAADRILLTGLDAPGSLIDLRAPDEFRRGSLMGSVNLPILTDRERHEVGLRYRQEGQDSAIALGERLVSGAVREARIDGWETLLTAQPAATLYCWRGGLRSRRATQWLQARGLSVEASPGGYQALRRRALALLDTYPQHCPLLILAGRTGVGKTQVLGRSAASIDLEGLARHRGSAFGSLPQPQPTQVSFENALAAHCLDHRRRAPGQLLLEDESRTIGRVAVPEAWFGQMQSAPVVMLTAPLAERVAHIEAEYVTQPLRSGTAPQELLARYLHAISRIRKRLGGVREQSLIKALRQGFEHGEHAGWIEALLTQYYDPMYDYQLKRKEARVRFSGDAQAVLDWLASGAAAGGGRETGDRIGREVGQRHH
ncbi:MAG: tRNA 2-selenouridine(34) synthase MnmH [Pseudomonadota bacterium]